MRHHNIVIIGTPCKPSKHISCIPFMVTEVSYNKGTVYGEIVEEGPNYLSIKDFYTSEVFRIGVRHVHHIKNANIVEDVTDITAWKYYNKTPGPTTIETRYILVGEGDKIKKDINALNSQSVTVLRTYDLEQ